jgi:hypothetical protein
MSSISTVERLAGGPSGVYGTNSIAPISQLFQTNLRAMAIVLRNRFEHERAGLIALEVVLDVLPLPERWRGN